MIQYIHTNNFNRNIPMPHLDNQTDTPAELNPESITKVLKALGRVAEQMEKERLEETESPADKPITQTLNG